VVKRFPSSVVIDALLRFVVLDVSTLLKNEGAGLSLEKGDAATPETDSAMKHPRHSARMAILEVMIKTLFSIHLSM
jgi:hypothetical protein